MKRTIFKAICLVTLIVFAISFAACTATYSVNKIKEENTALEDRIRSSNVQYITDEKWVLEGYANIYQMISNGDRSKASDYAQLLREITRNTIEFEDEDVFEIADKCSSVFNKLAQDQSEIGLQAINATKNGNGVTVQLKVLDVDVHKYSVQLLSADDPDTHPDGSIDYDGAMGKYRVLITISDIDICNSLTNTYAINQIYSLGEFSSAQLKLKIVSPDVHSAYIYIGSDKPLSVTECSSQTLYWYMDSMGIDINIG